jgi:hypothetical protein
MQAAPCGMGCEGGKGGGELASDLLNQCCEFYSFERMLAILIAQQSWCCAE